MNRILEKVKDQKGKCCVTIMLNTHRTLPDNEKDPLLLKNLVKEAEKRVKAECYSTTGEAVIGKLHELVQSVDHRHNLESLILFVNSEIAEMTRLPVSVTDKVVIGESFATRELFRVLLRQTNYYVLLLSKSNARLIEALDERVVREVEDGFPMENTLHPVQASEAAIANRVDNLGNTFFNVVDKELQKVLRRKKLPVVIYSDSANFHDYLKVANHGSIILGNVTGNNKMQEKAFHIIRTVWLKVKNLVNENGKKRLAELKESVNNVRFVTDLNEIWKTIQKGRGRTLFIKQGYFQPARVVDDTILPVAPNQANEPGVIEDVIDMMLEKNLAKGGDAVFVSNGDLDPFQGLVLTTHR